jgi:hypothetical protein
MTVIASGEPICDGEFAGRRACVCGHPERHRCPECGLVASEVVPADQLAEAVDAVREAVALLDALVDSDDLPLDVGDRLDSVRRASRRLAGRP